MFSFKIKLQDQNSKARIGVLNTPHGQIETPAFMPVATLGTVKSISNPELEDLGVQILIANLYHLLLRPGMEVIKKFQGLHNFMNWQKPIMTDSGGFQVFSLATLRKINKEGAKFNSHIDGKEYFLTPEKVIEYQSILKSDLIMPLDICSPFNVGHKEAKEALEITNDWLVRSIKSFESGNPRVYVRGTVPHASSGGTLRSASSFAEATEGTPIHPRSHERDFLRSPKLAEEGKNQALFGIIQGGLFDDLRIQSAQFVSQQKVFGIAVGGLSVGEKRKDMYHILDVIAPYLPKDRPQHLLGVGEPNDLLESIERGMDLFDCVLPTRLARHGTALTSKGKINLRQEKYIFDKNPLDKKCCCFVCQNYSLGYLRHLVHEKEILGIRFLTFHNLNFMLDLITGVKKAIAENKWGKFKKEFLDEYQG